MKLLIPAILALSLISCRQPHEIQSSDVQTKMVNFDAGVTHVIITDQDTGCQYIAYGSGMTIRYTANGKPMCRNIN